MSVSLRPTVVGDWRFSRFPHPLNQTDTAMATNSPSNQSDPAKHAAEHAELARQEYRFFRRLALVTLALSCAIALSLNLVDPDLWGHIVYGQELLAEGTLPATATHTFTTPDHRWINHENLAEIVLAVGFDTLGAPGMLVAKCLLGMGLLWLMVSVAKRQGVASLTAWAVMLLVAHNMIPFFVMRPQLLSFMWFSLMLVLLDRAFARWDEGHLQARWLWFLPVLMVAWTNSHGAFLAGLCILEAYLVGRAIECLCKQGSFKQSQKAWATVSKLAATGIACAAVTLINPYGADLLIWLASSLGQPRPEITEWAPPSMGSPVFPPFVLLVGIMVGSLLATRRQRDWTQIFVLALITWQAASHLRHIALLAILCGFWLPPHLQSAMRRLRPQGANPLPIMRLSPLFGRVLTIVLASSIALMSVGLFDQISSLPVTRDRYPIDALQYMVDRNLTGKLVVTFNWAQYAIAALAPDVEVAFDGRFRTCYPQEVVDMNFDFLLGENGGHRQRCDKSGPIDGTRVLEFGQPNLVLVEKAYAEPVRIMQELFEAAEPEWTLLYVDGTAQLWGRRDLYDDPALASFIAPHQRIHTENKNSTSQPWPALPRPRKQESIATTPSPEPQPLGHSNSQPSSNLL